MGENRRSVQKRWVVATRSAASDAAADDVKQSPFGWRHRFFGAQCVGVTFEFVVEIDELVERNTVRSRDLGVTAGADVVGIVCEVGVGKAYGAALEPVHLDEADLGPVIERLHLVGVTLREPIAAAGSSDKDDKDQ